MEKLEENFLINLMLRDGKKKHQFIKTKTT